MDLRFHFSPYSWHFADLTLCFTQIPTWLKLHWLRLFDFANVGPKKKIESEDLFSETFSQTSQNHCWTKHTFFGFLCGKHPESRSVDGGPYGFFWTIHGCVHLPIDSQSEPGAACGCSVVSWRTSGLFWATTLKVFRRPLFSGELSSSYY